MFRLLLFPCTYVVQSAVYSQQCLFNLLTELLYTGSRLAGCTDKYIPVSGTWLLVSYADYGCAVHLCCCCCCCCPWVRRAPLCFVHSTTRRLLLEATTARAFASACWLVALRVQGTYLVHTRTRYLRVRNLYQVLRNLMLLSSSVGRASVYLTQRLLAYCSTHESD